MGTERTESSSLRHPLGAHDVGGRPGPTVVKDEHEHALWERRVDAMMLLLTHPSRKLVWGIWCQALNGNGVSFSIRHWIAAARGMTTGGELATGRHSSRHKLVCGRSLRIGTMMQPCASAAKFRSGGSILHSGLTAMLTLGAPPPRIVIGPPLSRLERAQNAVSLIGSGSP